MLLLCTAPRTFARHTPAPHSRSSPNGHCSSSLPLSPCAALPRSGCGNTLNCNHPTVRQLILDCLRYWVTEYHVDGFRFDLASIMTRAHSAWHPAT